MNTGAETLRWRGILGWMGGLLALLAIAYVAHRAIDADWSALEGRWDGGLVVALILAALVYALAGGLLTLAWRLLLGTATPVGGLGRAVFTGYATTQIYKYLPGNVLHLLGRHVTTRSLGLPHRVLAAAAGMEILGLLAAAGLVTLLCGRLRELGETLAAVAPELRRWLPLAVVVLLLLVVAVVAALLLRLRGVPRRQAMPALAAALGVYGLFFLLSAFALGIVAQAGLQLDGPGFRALLAATTISWALGFLVPGAPAGLGVRETVLILLLTPAAGPAPAVALAALFRLVTLAGDGLLALGGLVLGRSGRRDPPVQPAS